VKWLHRALEGYGIDKDLVGRETANGLIPKTPRPEGPTDGPRCRASWHQGSLDQSGNLANNELEAALGDR
jgi:hypothetical protein